MRKFVARAKVLATTFVTYAVIAGYGLSGAVLAIEPYSHVPYVGVVVKWGGVAASALGTAVVIARKVTQVPDELVGLLLPEPPEASDGFWS